jgi:hypothetical protein
MMTNRELYSLRESIRTIIGIGVRRDAYMALLVLRFANRVDDALREFYQLVELVQADGGEDVEERIEAALDVTVDVELPVLDLDRLAQALDASGYDEDLLTVMGPLMAHTTRQEN